MGLGSNLPVIVPGMIVLIVVSVAAALALAWTKDSAAQLLIRRVWIGVSALVVVGVVVFWVSSAMVGTREPTVDRGAQQQQQNDLQDRLKNGGH